MTNEQAKALAEKVWGAYAMRHLSTNAVFNGGCDSPTEYHIAIWHGPGTEHEEYFGDSWESAFLAAGVDVCRYPKYACVHDSTRENYLQFIPLDNEIGYRLVEPKEETNG